MKIDVSLVYQIFAEYFTEKKLFIVLNGFKATNLLFIQSQLKSRWMTETQR